MPFFGFGLASGVLAQSELVRHYGGPIPLDPLAVILETGVALLL